jgi:hypothetical protein
MNYDKKFLKSLWEKEKNAYQEQEISNGVQSFVKKLLQSSEIFNLKEGNLSTKEDERKNEFLEEKSKKNKRADIVIFIDNQTIIPVEIEKYTYIQKGEEQLFHYQLAWDKKIGILTDGYEWIFYIGKTPLKKFTLTQILEETDLFISFWKEYTLPINYYLHFFEKNTNEESIEEDLNIEKNRQHFFTDITTLIQSFQNKLQLKGYFQGIEKEKNSELVYAYLIQFILYKTLSDNYFGDFRNDYEKRVERIEKNLKNESFSDILTVTKAISDLVSKNIYRPFKSEQEVINQTLLDILSKPKNDLNDVTPWLDIFVFIKRYSFANIRNEIFGFIYENYLKQLYNKNLGQYFTAPQVVDFMLSELGYEGKNLLKDAQNDKISIIDPSCGSGTFLYSATRNLIECSNYSSKEDSLKVEKWILNNIFGLDVSEFPLYLAEMSIIMRMLPLILNEDYTNVLEKKIKVFITKDSISEFLDTSVKNTTSDLEKQIKKDKGQMSLDFGNINLGYKSHVRDEDDLKNMKKSLENNVNSDIQRYRFDYVIGNPPYISYKDCAKKGVLSFQFIKEGKLKLNDVYGMNLHSIPEAPKGYRPNPNLYAFFIALGLELLKENGKLCYIIPQTLLTAGDLDVVRYHLARYTIIEKIIILNTQLFKSRGLNQNYTVATSNLILILKKQIPNQSIKNFVEIVYHPSTSQTIEECIEEIKNKKSDIIKRSEVSQEELLNSSKNWNFLKYDDNVSTFYKYYLHNSRSIDLYYNHDIAKKEIDSLFYFDGGYTVIEKNALDIPIPNILNYEIAKIDEKRILIPENRKYIPNKRGEANELVISLREANQAYSLLDSSYKIVWSTRNPKQFHFTDRPIIWSNNRLGGIGSENKNELLYLFAILNSSINTWLIHTLMKSEGEKDLLVQVKFIKEFVRIPKVDSDSQKVELKNKIIQLTEELIQNESTKLSDFVDFSALSMQKFEEVVVENDVLILKTGKNKSTCKIIQNNLLVKAFFESKSRAYIENMTLNMIKNEHIIDEKNQVELKNKIDNFVFCLYFNTSLNELENNNFYRFLNDFSE